MRRSLLLIISLVLLISGCSTRLAYNYLDWWLDWTIEDYVSLNDEQQRHTKAAIDRLHLWHRHQQLPLYATYLDGLGSAITSESLTQEQLNTLLDDGYDLWTNLLNELLNDSSQLLSSLSDEQTEELFANIEKYQEKEFAEKYVANDMEKLKQRSLKSRQEFFKTWLGPLSKDQQALISHWHQQSKPFGPTALTQRRQWRQEFAELLAQRSAEHFAPQLAEMLHYPPERWVPEYREQVKHNQTINQQLIMALHASLTEKQKRHCRKRLQGYIKDFQHLAKQGADSKPTG